MNAFIESSRAQDIRSYHLPRYHELPQIDIYLDQLLTILQKTLEPLFTQEEQKFITASMINNYTKHGVISRPTKKKYCREQIAHLIFIVINKQVASLNAIQGLLQIQARSYPSDVAYDYFCTEFENALHALFSDQERFPDSATTQTEETVLMRACVSAAVHKIYLNLYLEYAMNAANTASE